MRGREGERGRGKRVVDGEGRGEGVEQGREGGVRERGSKGKEGRRVEVHDGETVNTTMLRSHTEAGTTKM